MEKVQIVVESATGSSLQYGELYSSGLIRYQNGTYSHVTIEVKAGKKVSDFVEPIIKPASAVRSAAVKSKKKMA